VYFPINTADSRSVASVSSVQWFQLFFFFFQSAESEVWYLIAIFIRNMGWTKIHDGFNISDTYHFGKCAHLSHDGPTMVYSRIFHNYCNRVEFKSFFFWHYPSFHHTINKHTHNVLLKKKKKNVYCFYKPIIKITYLSITFLREIAVAFFNNTFLNDFTKNNDT